MKVYLLWEYEYTDTGLLGIFKSAESAFAYAQKSERWSTLPDVRIEHGLQLPLRWSRGMIEEMEVQE